MNIIRRCIRLESLGTRTVVYVPRATIMSTGSPPTPWSSFHSNLVKTPGTPVRQSITSTSGVAVRESSSQNLADDFSSLFMQLDLQLEYKLLCLNCPSGVYVVPSSKSLYEWHGVIFVHSGPYRDAVFKFIICIPDEFPRMRPMLRFVSKAYHPYIHASNGVLNMSRVFPVWDPGRHHLWHVVQYTKQCFYSKETWGDDCDKEAFLTMAHKCAVESVREIYRPQSDVDYDNPIKLSELDQKSLLTAKKLLIQGELPTPQVSQQSILSNVTEQFKYLWDRMFPT